MLDPSSRDYDKSDILKANNAIIYCALMDENTQVNGLTFLVDCSHFTMRHKLFWGVDTMKKTIKLLQVRKLLQFARIVVVVVVVVRSLRSLNRAARTYTKQSSLPFGQGIRHLVYGAGLEPDCDWLFRKSDIHLI